MTTTNKRLLISESHDDSNCCTSCNEKPDKYDTYASHASPRTPAYASCRLSTYVTTFHEVINSDGQSHCSWEKWLLTQSIARRLTDPRVHTEFLSQVSHWTSGGRATLYWRQTTRLTRPINTSMRSVHSILAHGYHPSFLNRHKRVLPYRNLKIATTISLPFPSKCSTDPP
jgi:hypothetical protein